jgi:hypothetical protein
MESDFTKVNVLSEAELENCRSESQYNFYRDRTEIGMESPI